MDVGPLGPPRRAAGGRQAAGPSPPDPASMADNLERGFLHVATWNIILLGVIFQNVFSPKAAGPETPSLGGDPRIDLKVWCHEVTFPKCRTS